jgi:hypothetical protein
MRQIKRYASPVMIFLALVLVFITAGCKVAPKKEALQDIITQYFEARKYRVLELNITDIQPLHLREKTYMGTDAYTVIIHSITLAITENSGPPWFYRTGQEVTFRDAAITIKEGRGKRGTWIIHDITGIAVP